MPTTSNSPARTLPASPSKPPDGLVERSGAMLVGSGTSAVELMPPVDGDNQSPVHAYLLVNQGVPMGELHYLGDLPRLVLCV